MIQESELKRIGFAIEIAEQIRKPLGPWVASCIQELYFNPRRFTGSMVKGVEREMGYSLFGLRIIGRFDTEIIGVDAVILPSTKKEPRIVKRRIRREIEGLEEPKIQANGLDFFKKWYRGHNRLVLAAMELGRKENNPDLVRILYPKGYVGFLCKKAGVIEESFANQVSVEAAVRFLKSSLFMSLDPLILRHI